MLRSNVARFYIFWAFANFALWLPIWIVFMQERGLGLDRLGVLEAVAWLIMAAMEVPTGAVADKFGRKTSLALGALLHGAAIYGVTAEVLSPLFLIAYMAWGASWTFISGADMAFVYDTLKEEGREDEHPKVAGRTLAVMHGSTGAASLIGAWLATFDMDACFQVSAGCLVIAALVALTLKEPKPINEHQHRNYLETLQTALHVAAVNPSVRYQVLFGAATMAFPFILTLVLLQPYAAETGLPLIALGPIVLGIRVFSVLGATMSDRAARTLGPKRIVVSSLFVMFVGQLLLWIVASRPVMFAFIAIAFFSSVMRPVLSALLNREIPSAQRATILSLQSLVWTLLLAVLEPLILGVADRISVAFATGLAGVLTVVATVPLVALWWKHSRLPARIAALEPITGADV